MPDSQFTENDYRSAASKVVYSIFGMLALKWIIILGLNRWSRSLK